MVVRNVMSAAVRSLAWRPRGTRPTSVGAGRSLTHLGLCLVIVMTLIPTVLLGTAAAQTATVGANVNVSVATGNQTEASVAVNPANGNQVFAFSNDESQSLAGLRAGRSTDGGQTWTVFNLGTGTGGDGFTPACCDPTAAWDEFGNLFVGYLGFPTGGLTRTIELLVSTDGGQNFTNIGPIDAGPNTSGSLDQPTVTAGNGQVWVTWRTSSTVGIQARGASVTGSGAIGTFTAADTLTGSVGGNYGDVVIGDNGEVVVAYQIPSGGQGPATIFTHVDPDGTGPMLFGGQQTATTTNVGGFDFIPPQPDRSVDAEAGLAFDRSGGPNDGRLYLVYTEETVDESNDTDILVRSSDDNGATWSAPIQTNDDTGTNSQFLPRIALDQTTGNVAVTWHDSRLDDGSGPNANDTNGVANDDALYWGTFSVDGGTSFLPNLQISAGTSDEDGADPPAACCANIDYGDYTGLAFDAGIAHAVWADNSNSTGDNPDGTLNRFDIYTSRLTLSENQSPTADADGPYTTNEGTAVALDGTGSSDPDGDPLTFEWDLDDDGTFEAGGETPSFIRFDNGTFPVCLRVTDPDGASDTDCSEVTVNNVAPTVTLDAIEGILEGGTANAAASFSDPGSLDTYTATIEWGHPDLGTDPASPTLTTDGPPGPDQGEVSGSKQIGDDGTFTVTVTVNDDDGGSGSSSAAVTVDNVDPTAAIDLSGATVINGTPTILGTAGSPVDLSGTTEDPGSDDLEMSWDFDDGTPVVMALSLVNPPATDPDPSPTVQPRSVTDMRSHTFGDACVYRPTFMSSDDDGGSASDSAAVIINGDADRRRSVGYWHNQYKKDGAQSVFDQDTLGCYLAIARLASAVYDEERALTTLSDARRALGGTGDDSIGAFDRELLAAWLNFANGSLGFDESVDTDGDGLVDTSFGDAVTTAEGVRLDPGSTSADIEAQREILHEINQPSS